LGRKFKRKRQVVPRYQKKPSQISELSKHLHVKRRRRQSLKLKMMKYIRKVRNNHFSKESIEDGLES